MWYIEITIELYLSPTTDLTSTHQTHRARYLFCPREGGVHVLNFPFRYHLVGIFTKGLPLSNRKISIRAASFVYLSFRVWGVVVIGYIKYIIFN